MKKELEVKILDIDENAWRRKLAHLGARLVFDGLIRTASYDFSRLEGAVLYLKRKTGGEGLLAFADAQRGEHLDTIVTDYAETGEILTTIGLENRNESWRAPRKLRSLDERGFRLRLRNLVDEERDLDLGQLTLKTDRAEDTLARCNEYETDLSEYDAAREILKRFGMGERRRYEKRRAEFLLAGGVKVVIDHIPGIAPYGEVEAPDDASVVNAVNGLGYTMKDTVTLSGRKIRERHNGK